MTVNISKPTINIREKLSELDFAKVPFQKMPSGSVLQVVQTVKTDSFGTSSSTSYTDITGLSVSITPTSSSNKVLVLCTVGFSNTSDALLQLLRDSTVIGSSTVGTGANRGFAFLSTAISGSLPLCINYLDSPSTTSATTYKVQGRVFDGGQSFSINRRTGDTIFGGSSTITAMEIAG